MTDIQEDPSPISVGGREPASPLTGRDSELRWIAGALEDTGGVLLAGAAGVGKTRLTRAALATQAADRVPWVIATDSARRIPLGAFAPLLDELPDGASAALPAAHAALRGGLTVLAVDDAHLLDDVSATLLNQLGVDHEYRMVITVRTEHQAPDAVTALWKDGLLTRVDVAALTAEQTTMLLERVLVGPLERVSAQRLFTATATAGNVFWLRHLVDGERGRRTAGVHGGHVALGRRTAARSGPDRADRHVDR